ncbi:MAG: hypothetical protein HY237_11565 [Acidobacteria bacterium]|nr:hypothetical protein [Acidobacteriota bacterium]
MPAIRRVLLILLAILLLLLFLAVPGVSWAQAPDASLDAAARQLARKITAALPPREAIVLNLRNISSLAPADAGAVRRAMEAELLARGVRLVEPSAEHVAVRVTLSENLESYVWVADFTRGETPVVAIVALSRPVAGKATVGAPLALQKQLVWEQEEPILDLALLARPAGADFTMLVLEPGELVVYARNNDQWNPRQRFPIVSPKPWPRDLRGKLVPLQHLEADATVFVASLPGASCILAVEGIAGAPSLTCKQSDKAGEQEEGMRWALFAGDYVAEETEFVSSRNFFTGQLYGARGPRARVEPFFSAALLLRGEESFATIHAGVDGLIRLYDEGGRQLATHSGWGSDLTSMQTKCGDGWQVLATRLGDWTASDAVTAYEIVDHQPRAVSLPVDLPGPVTALGPLGEGASVAVVRNLRTGRYEAYQLSISCGR